MRTESCCAVTQTAATVFRPPWALIQKETSTDAKKSDVRCFYESIYEILLKSLYDGGKIFLCLCHAVPMPFPVPFCGIGDCKTGRTHFRGRFFQRTLLRAAMYDQ